MNLVCFWRSLGCFTRRNFLTLCFPLRLRSDKEWKRLYRGTLGFVFWFCCRYSLCCSDQFSLLEGRRTHQKTGSCTSWSRGNAGLQCMVAMQGGCRKVSEEVQIKLGSLFLCSLRALRLPYEPLMVVFLLVYICNMFFWLYRYTHNTGTNGERFCFCPSGCKDPSQFLLVSLPVFLDNVLFLWGSGATKNERGLIWELWALFSGSATVTPCATVINFHYLKEEERSKMVEAAIAEAEAMQGGCRKVSEEVQIKLGSLFLWSLRAPLYPW